MKDKKRSDPLTEIVKTPPRPNTPSCCMIAVCCQEEPKLPLQNVLAVQKSARSTNGVAIALIADALLFIWIPASMFLVASVFAFRDTHISLAFGQALETAPFRPE